MGGKPEANILNIRMLSLPTKGVLGVLGVRARTIKKFIGKEPWQPGKERISPGRYWSSEDGSETRKKSLTQVLALNQV